MRACVYVCQTQCILQTFSSCLKMMKYMLPTSASDRKLFIRSLWLSPNGPNTSCMSTCCPVFSSEIMRYEDRTQEFSATGGDGDDEATFPPRVISFPSDISFSSGLL